MRVGVLGFQGDLEEHLASTRIALEKKGLTGEVCLVKSTGHLEGIDALIIGGGESTVIGRMAAVNGTLASVRERVLGGMPVLGTCAGLVLLAGRAYDRVVGEIGQPLLGVLDVLVERNAFGRQRESFEADLEVPILGEERFRGVFIRAPLIKEMGPEVREMARLNDGVVAVQQANILATSFHPELTRDTRMHEYFLDVILQHQQRNLASV